LAHDHDRGVNGYVPGGKAQGLTLRFSGVADVLVGLGVQEHAAISGWIRSLVAAVVAVRAAVIAAADAMRAG
jgi:hypothetical protein